MTECVCQWMTALNSTSTEWKRECVWMWISIKTVCIKNGITDKIRLLAMCYFVSLGEKQIEQMNFGLKKW